MNKTVNSWWAGTKMDISGLPAGNYRFYVYGVAASVFSMSVNGISVSKPLATGALTSSFNSQGLYVTVQQPPEYIMFDAIPVASGQTVSINFDGSLPQSPGSLTASKLGGVQIVTVVPPAS